MVGRFSRPRRVAALALLAAACVAGARPPAPSGDAWAGAVPCPPVAAAEQLRGGRAASGSLPRPGCAARFVFDPADCLAQGRKCVERV
jgi:hypothetical protein